MDGAYEVIEASRHQPVPDSLSYQYAQEVMAGLACMKADFLGLDLRPIAVWDGQPGDGFGGTADFVSLWQQRGHEVDIIGLGQGTSPMKAEQRSSGPRTRFRFGSQEQHLKAMLFADVRHFSRLTEAQLPLFVEKFMGTASAVIARSAHRPVVINTWGDEFYMVFDTIEDAGMLALELRTALCPPPQGDARWETAGLPAELSVRFAVHAGPVFAIADPVVRHLSFTGRHTTQTARLEPVTKPGEIFATREFAALAHLQGIRGFTCVYLGRTDLAKGYHENEAIYQVVPQAT
jgi:class 3 adenylate cyclase